MCSAREERPLNSLASQSVRQALVHLGTLLVRPDSNILLKLSEEPKVL